MTIRHTVQATIVATSIALGCVALPIAASAAPASAAAPAYAVVGSDGLAGYANKALDHWTDYAQTGRASALTEFDTLRDAVAAAAADRLGLDAATMQAAWRNADSGHQVALMAAFTQLGTPYKRNTSKPGVGFDCSGLTTWAWAQAGVTLARQSRSQINNAVKVTRDTAQAGDLVYYPGHVMMYLGVDTAVIHALYPGRNLDIGFVSKNKANSVRFGNPMG